jgi:hypothetical protein
MNVSYITMFLAIIILLDTVYLAHKIPNSNDIIWLTVLYYICDAIVNILMVVIIWQVSDRQNQTASQLISSDEIKVVEQDPTTADPIGLSFTTGNTVVDTEQGDDSRDSILLESSESFTKILEDVARHDSFAARTILKFA